MTPNPVWTRAATLAAALFLTTSACTYTEAKPGLPDRPNTGEAVGASDATDNTNLPGDAIGFAVDGIAGEVRYVSNTDSGLNMRVGPGTTNESQGRLPNGTRVTLTGDISDIDGERWVEVTSGVLQGWVHSGYLISSDDYEQRATTTERVVSTWPEGTILRVAAAPGANLRDAPAGEVILELRQDTEVVSTGPEDNGWVPVAAGTLNGWLFAELLDRASFSNVSSPTGPDTTVTPTGELDGVNVRSAPSGTIVIGIPAGDVAQLTGNIAGDWSEVIFRGVRGWALTDLLSATDEPVTGPAATGTVTKTGDVVAIHSEPAQTSPVLTSLDDGSTVVLTGSGTASGWLEIELGVGTTGWIPGDYVTRNS